MAKESKEFMARMDGMSYALRIAKEKGIEELEKDLKMRNFMKASTNYSKDEIKRFWNFISENCYNNMLTAVAVSLHECFGFGKDRLRKFKGYFDKIVCDTQNLDYMGEHYVKLEDLAIEMNEKFDLGINVDSVSACQDIKDEKTGSNYHYAKVERMVEEMREAGFSDAATWVEKKVK